MLIGAVAELGIFRSHPLLMAGTLASLFFARWLAIQSSYWAWKGIGAHSRELILWVLPRGLITVVLAIKVAEARGIELEFVPGLAFAVILVTNALLVLASFRARRATPAVAEAVPGTPVYTSAVPAPAHPRRRWILNAAMLFLLAVGGVVLWYGNHPERLQPKGAVQWIKLHLHRAQ